MRKTYAASWNLFILTAKADRVLYQLVMFLTVFLHWMYKMKYSCYQESSNIHGWFVYWVFAWEMRRLSKSEPISADGIVFVFHLACLMRKSGFELISWSSAQLIYAPSLCMFVRFETMIWSIIRFDISLQNSKRALDIFSHLI